MKSYSHKKQEMDIKNFKYTSILMLLGFTFLFDFGAFAQKKTVPKLEPEIKIALESYSFSKLFNDQIQGRGAGISLYDFLNFGAVNNFDAVSLTGYFFPSYPEAPKDEFIYDIKRRAYYLGLNIVGLGVRNDFANPDPAKRAADVKHVKEWIDVAVKLGSPVIRIFSGKIPEGYENRWQEIATYMAKSIKECADYGKEKGVIVAVQNHGDFLKTADESIKLVKMVNSEWFGVIVDSGYFISDNPYADMTKVMPYAINFLLKENLYSDKETIKVDLLKTAKLLKESGFRGNVAIETLSPKKSSKASSTKGSTYNPYLAVPAFLKEVRIAIDSQFKN